MASKNNSLLNHGVLMQGIVGASLHVCIHSTAAQASECFHASLTQPYSRPRFQTSLGYLITELCKQF